ncbi:hypothetical protein G7K_4800-t1 [Saitoella complicata NRRL Y-17804]|uniref:Uncharacterized protein n=1 Tax=Saitoella complicata (strain BCRC 22490 / CBS 7301 / JCM 7358 / NBRC 10748 / NRRL Y-17804) TaxID=698492 RepID=A0A0E9NLK4_SAICN|nr:hypothetical protein G7K_4800-t1 [Saitoella complicata NRRL Y-17804]
MCSGGAITGHTRRVANISDSFFLSYNPFDAILDLLIVFSRLRAADFSARSKTCGHASVAQPQLHPPNHQQSVDSQYNSFYTQRNIYLISS